MVNVGGFLYNDGSYFLLLSFVSGVREPLITATTRPILYLNRMSSLNRRPTETDILVMAEKCMEVCFQMVNMDNPAAISVSVVTHHRYPFRVDFNVHAGHSAAIDKPADYFPGKVRVYCNHAPSDDFELVRGSLERDGQSDVAFIARRGGIILPWKRVGIRMHLCSNGLNIHFDARIFPQPVYNHAVGETRPKVHKLAVARPKLDLAKTAAEAYISSAFTWVILVDPQAFTLGKGGSSGEELFVDVIIYDPSAVPGHRYGLRGQVDLPRAYRVYLEARQYVVDQIPVDLIKAKKSNKEFKEEYNGYILDVGFIKMDLHVCPVGVQIRFRPENTISATLVRILGPSRARMNANVVKN